MIIKSGDLVQINPEQKGKITLSDWVKFGNKPLTVHDASEHWLAIIDPDNAEAKVVGDVDLFIPWGVISSQTLNIEEII